MTRRPPTARPTNQHAAPAEAAPRPWPLLGAAAGTAVPPAALHLCGAPWWALLTTWLLTTTAGTLATLLSSVFPQESADRLAWWNTLFNLRNHPARQPARTPRRSPPHP